MAGIARCVRRAADVWRGALHEVSMASERYGKDVRLRKRLEFLRVQRLGVKASSKSFLIFTRRNSVGHARLGITASKRVGNAVARNRIKRLVREVFRRNRDKFPAALDIVVVAKQTASAASYEAARAELCGAVRKLRR
jgi:ribonuclease P protein component